MNMARINIFMFLIIAVGVRDVELLTTEQEGTIRTYFEGVISCMDIPGFQMSLVINDTVAMTMGLYLISGMC